VTRQILIVEDDRELQDLYATMLRGMDCDIVRAYDGGEALDKLGKEVPDLVILDILLDEMMGDQFFLKMKENPLYTDVPVIVASVLGLERCKNLFKVDPTTRHLRKPFKREQLITIVEACLGTNHKG
jgi:two-component system response regulator VicR